MVRQLSISDVSRIHSQGGSILRTSRTNPSRNSEDLLQVAQGVRELGLDYLVTIGGDDIKVAHVPKTIDNDLLGSLPRVPKDDLRSGLGGFRTSEQCPMKNQLRLLDALVGLDAGVANGLGNGGQPGVVRICAAEAVGDETHRQSGIEVGPSNRRPCAAVAKRLEGGSG